ncbi:hypothetical protein C1645_739525 [Glomus cerebriforme]|uniref:Uncharacterized protein n=1 Tax=Glomus cerebriforme TaxID=658196 RepID=A0A397SZN7_9GLOM|nr:hypothetical protein C1645_739525 [Glomus cerebriforme]
MEKEKKDNNSFFFSLVFPKIPNAFYFFLFSGKELNSYQKLLLEIHLFITYGIQKRGSVQRNGNYPLISSYEGELVNVFCFENTLEQQSQNIPITQDSIVENENNYIIESDDDTNIIYNKTKELLDESRNKPKWHLWLKNIRSNFNSLEKMNKERF